MSKELFKKVKKVALKNVFPEFNYPSGFDHAIIDENNNILNFCSPKYNLVPNSEVFLPVENILNNMGIKYKRKINVIKGSKFYVDYIIKDNNTQTKVNDVYPKISIWNSYDGALRFRKEFGYYKLVCTNGLTSPLNVFETIKKKHSKPVGFGNIDSVKDFLKTFSPSVEQFLINSTEDFNLFSNMNSIPSTVAQLEALAEEMNFSKKALEVAVDRYKHEVAGGFSFENIDGINVNHDGSPESLFTVYNSLNYTIYNTQEKELPEKKLQKDIKLVSLVEEVM